MSSEKKTNFQNVITRADVKRAVHSAPNVIRPNHVGSFNVTSVQGLGPCLTVVLIPSAGHASQLVIHRPVGCTDLDDKDWVMSMSGDIDLLLARSKDPDESKIRVVQQQNRTAFLVKKGLLKEKNGIYFYVGHEVVPRNDYLDQADRAFVTAKKEKKTSSTSRRVDYLPDPVKAYEIAIMEVLKTPEATKEIEKGAVRTFRTRGGVLDDQDQRAIVGLRGKSLAEVYAVLPKLMIEGIGRGEKVELKPSVVVPEATSVDVRALEEQIRKKFESDVARMVDHHEALIGDAIARVGDIYKYLNMGDARMLNPGIAEDLKGLLSDLSNVLEDRGQDHDH